MSDIGMYLCYWLVGTAADNNLYQKSKRLTQVNIYTMDQWFLPLILTQLEVETVNIGLYFFYGPVHFAGDDDIYQKSKQLTQVYV